MCLKKEFICAINISLKSGNAKRDKSMACTGIDSSSKKVRMSCRDRQCGELV